MGLPSIVVSDYYQDLAVGNSDTYRSCSSNIPSLGAIETGSRLVIFLQEG